MRLPTPAVLRAQLREAIRIRGAEHPDVDPIADEVCDVPRQLAPLIAKLDAYYKKPKKTARDRVQAGTLLESIVAFAFAGLSGLATIKSFPSMGSQYDLIARGSMGHEDWVIILEFLGLPRDRRDIVVEVKATEDKVSDKQMLRLSALLDAHFGNTCAMAVFVSLEGATGHPDRSDETATRSLRDAYLHQVLHFARTGVPIVVLDIADVRQLAKRGALVRALLRKAQELRDLRGKPEPAPDIQVADVPPHMAAAARWLHGRRSPRDARRGPRGE